jgi:hypothetical protein
MIADILALFQNGSIDCAITPSIAVCCAGVGICGCTVPPETCGEALGDCGEDITAVVLLVDDGPLVDPIAPPPLVAADGWLTFVKLDAATARICSQKISTTRRPTPFTEVRR